MKFDIDAVTAGLTLPYSSGVVEGHVDRIKKRSNGRCTAELRSTSWLLASPGWSLIRVGRVGSEERGLITCG
ncbi:hypothetical protein [Streptomyces venezuelae]|uniref:hypothetical protein n=1 Tax=Streptomyces venezuelae TaxID=54571 RepID=UPI0011B6E938|nr:hypothetical protein [Streptomyces venezuelae]